MKSILILTAVLLIGCPGAEATTGLTRTSECYHCKHKQNIVGEAHIRCLKPDPKMRGIKHGFIKGWFIYPACFDPVWKLHMCENFEFREEEQS